ncbi:MAG: molybdenum cofactor guanylyltransferase [Candidatus Ratteibacteria bacterium]
MYGIILAKGEKSRRIGKIKAFIEIEGITIIERMINEILDIFEKIIIVTTKPEIFEKIKNVEIVFDEYKIGPIGGILKGLQVSPHFYNFIFACDYPFLNKDIVRYMIEIEKDYDVLIPKKGNSIHPLFAIYSKRTIPVIEKNIIMKKYRVFDLLNELNVKYLERIKDFDYLFFNLNRKEDIKKLWEREF